ncbi:Meckel syndrome type 1 protein [Lingula anatina]|uniref:Meckel syndrome type 1 protein n=1 Tax=Lingula anatina TaxID=7574 RepID=A0A1S3HGE1_LINAN|nr:Meckel syndrome type 1 protein [Lingula anatina]|eukprot:XP_013384089.1 Meckel syndrome type 1 protein [Lingula anatina]
MVDMYDADTGAGYYRSRDPVKNLKIRVCVERVTSASIVPQAQLEKEHGGGMGLQDVRKQQQAMSKKDREEYTFSWQEKVFSQREVDLYSKEENCTGVLERKYHQDVQPLKEKGRPTKRLFSYTANDPFTDQKEHVQHATTSVSEQPNILSQRAANVRRRRVVANRKRESENAIVPKINIVDLEPTEESVKQNHFISTPQHTMYIMVDLSSADDEATIEDEYVLCVIKVDINGVISIKPDFSKGKKPYRIETQSIGREVYEYTLEDASAKMSRQEQDRERKMYKELYNRHGEFLTAVVGHDFEMPPPDVLRMLVYGEIVSAKNFDYDNLYIHYFVELPRNWRVDRNQQLSGVTQTCTTKVEGRDNVAYYSFPFNFEVFYKNETVIEENKDLLPKWPVMYIEVLSLDSWQRYRTEGYGYLTLPCIPGVSTEEVTCWRPTGNSVVSELRRFFIGGSPELEDLSYISVPSTFEGSHLSKYGFKTETTGSVTVRLNILHQSQAFLDKAHSKKKMGNLMDRLGATSSQLSIMNVLDAFQRARQRMISARENLLKEFKDLNISTTANEIKEEE